MPSCAECNRSKLDHDTVKEPIINPCNEDPKLYFYLAYCRYQAFDTSGNSKANITIDVLGLNNTKSKCLRRYEIVEKLLNKQHEICIYAKEDISAINTDTRKRNKIINTCRDLLEMCTPNAEYSAFTATALLKSQEYSELKTLLQNINQWNDELEELDQKSQKCVFKTSPINMEVINELGIAIRNY